jgi:hypothetical protein
LRGGIAHPSKKFHSINQQYPIFLPQCGDRTNSSMV